MSNTPPLYTLRQPVLMKVAQEAGLITEIHQSDSNTNRYRVLHLDHNQQRAQTWLPETEIEPLPSEWQLPLPDPYSTASSST